MREATGLSDCIVQYLSILPLLTIIKFGGLFAVLAGIGMFHPHTSDSKQTRLRNGY